MSFEQNQAAAAASKGFEAAAGVIRDEASCIVQESSGDSGSTLKAHDYIGLSEVTSMPVKNEKALPDLNLGETELRLGPPKNSSAGSDAKIVAAAAEAPLKFHDKIIPEAAKAEAEQDLQKSVFWPAQRMIPQHQQQQPQQQQDQNVAEMSSAFSIKNSNNKRAFSEAIGGNSFVDGRSTAAAPNPPPASGNLKAPPVMPSSMYPWSSSSKQLPAAWRMGLDQSKGSFGPFPSPRIHPQQPKLDSSPENSSGLTKDDAAEDAVPPSSSPPVVGWPPVQSFRKNTLASHPAPPQPKSEPSTKTSPAVTAASPAPAPSPPPSQAPATPLFVKVYMDGVPIGRKVDLKTNNSYDKLSSVLEDMFHRFITGQEASSSRDAGEKKLNFLHSSDFVLTYEDKDGDLMLVGDVPWGMFTGTVKRLRIMKGSEAIGLAPRAPAGDKAAC